MMDSSKTIMFSTVWNSLYKSYGNDHRVVGVRAKYGKDIQLQIAEKNSNELSFLVNVNDSNIEEVFDLIEEFNHG